MAPLSLPTGEPHLPPTPQSNELKHILDKALLLLRCGNESDSAGHLDHAWPGSGRTTGQQVAAESASRDGARPLFWALHACFTGLLLVWADAGSTGRLVGCATDQLKLTVQIVAKLAGQTIFVVLHRRWAVERTFSWINRCRRTVRDYERFPQHHAAMVQWAMIIIMTRRLARHHHTWTRYLPGS